MLTKRAMVLALVTGLVFSQAGPAFAARSGGRAGGFRAPSPARTIPRGGGGGYGGGGYGGGYRGGFGGGFGFPLMFPFFFGGGGGLFSLLIFFAIASFLVNTFRNLAASGGDGSGPGLSSTANPTVTVAKIQIGLLASARELQTDLNRVARTSDTSTNEGLSGLLQESVLALLRHPEYWAYGHTDGEVTKVTQAETIFNRYTLQARSKLAAETLSNVNGQLRNRDVKQALGAGDTLADVAEENEYIVATLIVASKGKLSIPQIDNASDLRQALRTVGAVSSEELYGVELLWEPQAEGDVLTADEVMADYPELRIVA